MISTWICFGVIQLVYSQVNITLDSFIGSTYQPLANRDVRLNCTAPGPCCQSSTREWAVERNGGFTIIYRDNTNNYPLKYAEDLQESLNQFNLIITNFDVDSDLTRYRCRYGFESSFYTLTMDEGLHYIPSEDEIEQKRNFTKGNIFSYAVNITRTYPLPNCSCTYGDDDLTSLMESTSGDNGVLKFLVLSLTNAVHECVGEFTIKCDIGFYQDQNIVRFMPCSTSSIFAKCKLCWLLLLLVCVFIIVYLCSNKNCKTHKKCWRCRKICYSDFPLARRNSLEEWDIVHYCCLKPCCHRKVCNKTCCSFILCRGFCLNDLPAEHIIENRQPLTTSPKKSKKKKKKGSDSAKEHPVKKRVSLDSLNSKSNKVFPAKDEQVKKTKTLDPVPQSGNVGTTHSMTQRQEPLPPIKQTSLLLR